ncbi:MAG: hypothetical protein ACKOYJ_03260 [Planctomycetia bacterium]
MPDSTPSTSGQIVVQSHQTALPESERRRLQKCFLAGEQKAATNVDYAIEMFTACVLGDPANAIYLQGLLTVLKRKFAGKKAGGLGVLFSAGARGGLKKSAAAGQWLEVLKKGIEILTSSPGDHGTLLAMSHACKQLNFQETQRVYLRAALDAAPGDAEVNRVCAEYLEARGEYDQAIACWERIKTVKGHAEEADRKITKLQVEKTSTRMRGTEGRPAAAPASKTSAVDEGEAEAKPAGKLRLAELREAIATDPAQIDPYLELADILEAEATIEEAEKLLHTALAASGNDIKVREHLEDRQLRWGRYRVHVAEKNLEAEDTPAHRATLEQLRVAQIQQEIQVYAARCQRYPENMTWRYELAVRLKAAGNVPEAIKHFQDVLQDSRRKGQVSLELGECFQKIKQYPLALRNYQAAIDTLTDREIDLRKRALYRAGVLSMATGDVDLAQKYLSELGGLDFGYRDVAQRLDKLASGKDKGAV